MQTDKNQAISEIKKLKSNKDYDGMLAAAQKAVSVFPDESKIFGFLEDAQTHYVDEKLDSETVKELEEKEDWMTLQSVYQKLLNVFPESKKLHKLIEKAKTQIGQKQVDQNDELLDELKNRIVELMKAGQLDDALQACYEFLSNNPENEEIQRLKGKIEAKLNHKIDQDLSAYFKESNPKLRKEYKADKEAFVTV
jgi:hypothetical protein